MTQQALRELVAKCVLNIRFEVRKMRQVLDIFKAAKIVPTS